VEDEESGTPEFADVVSEFQMEDEGEPATEEPATEEPPKEEPPKQELSKKSGIGKLSAFAFKKNS